MGVHFLKINLNEKVIKEERYVIEQPESVYSYNVRYGNYDFEFCRDYKQGIFIWSRAKNMLKHLFFLNLKESVVYKYDLYGDEDFPGYFSYRLLYQEICLMNKKGPVENILKSLFL